VRYFILVPGATPGDTSLNQISPYSRNVSVETTITVDWGKESVASDSPASLRNRIRSITENQSVLKSRDQLLKLYEESPKRGTVKTIDINTLSANDFEIAVPKKEFEKFENAFNQGDVPTEIVVTELEDSVLPGRFVPELISHYKFLEMDGLQADVDKIEKQGKTLILTIADVRL
jgi:hypothetical protein